MQRHGITVVHSRDPCRPAIVVEARDLSEHEAIATANHVEFHIPEVPKRVLQVAQLTKARVLGEVHTGILEVLRALEQLGRVGTAQLALDRPDIAARNRARGRHEGTDHRIFDEFHLE